MSRLTEVFGLCSRLLKALLGPRLAVASASKTARMLLLLPLVAVALGDEVCMLQHGTKPLEVSDCGFMKIAEFCKVGCGGNPLEDIAQLFCVILRFFLLSHR